MIALSSTQAAPLGFRRWSAGLYKHLRRAVIAVAFLISAMSLGIMVNERDLMYRREPARVPPSAARLEGVAEHVLETTDGERLMVWRVTAKPGQPTLLYFHGNGELLGYRADRIRRFQAAGYGVYMMAYRGFSGSSGLPSERANVADAKQAYDQLRREGLGSLDIVIYGESLGASVAVQTALTKPALGVILEAPFASMVATWRQFVPFLPVGLLLRDKYRTIKVIGGLTMPVLMMHGRRDGLVWFPQGEALFRAAPHPKRFAVFPQAGHMNLYSFGAMDAVRRFINDLRSGAAIE